MSDEWVLIHCFRCTPTNTRFPHLLTATIMLTVHHLDHSQSFRIVWLLEELQSLDAGVDYELKLYRRNESYGLAPSEYKDLSPLGTAPTITTTDGLVLNESNAIIEYILDLAQEGKKDTTTTPLMRPPISSQDRTKFLFWFHGVQGSMQPMLTVDIIFRRAVTKSPCLISSVVGVVSSKVRDAVILPRLKNLMEMAEIQLQKDNFLAGSEFTAADITAIYPFSSIFDRYPEFSKTYPKTQTWLDRMTCRKAYKSAQAKVGEEGGIVFENE